VSEVLAVSQDLATWWPSRYGADDEAGALNEIDAAARWRGLASVRRGEVLDLAHVLDSRSPAFPGRTFQQQLVTAAHAVNRRRDDGGPDGLGRNGVGWIVEHVQATSQMGTHLDGLNHLQIGDRAYNGHRLGDIVEEHGTNRLGIETLPQVVTRGLLLDVAAVRGVERLGPGDVVTPADAEAALLRIGATVEPGDAVLFHTGWGRLWDDDPVTYPTGEPGPGVALVDWLVAHRVALTGCDTWSYGPVPSEDPDRPFEVPQMLNVRHGVFIVENLDTAALAADGARRFALVLTHPKLRGATGAWTSPIALA
jgi:kynurenine formamidase